MAGGTSSSLAAACDEYVSYEALPGVGPLPEPRVEDDPAAGAKAAPVTDTTGQVIVPGVPKKGPTGLLVRALRLGHSSTDAKWLHSSWIKNQMLRMDPTFNEKSLGFTTFADFLRSRASVVELDDGGPIHTARLRDQFRRG